ncbi:MAG: hypothetical protein JXB35_13945 [Anaerolineae bacterium]|nr:hypothetical protein [Anaerolineae bacterium]
MMKLKSIGMTLGLAISLVALATIGLSPHPGNAQTTVLYVSSITGSDAGLCTQDVPCATIQRAIDLAVPGDEIRVASFDNLDACRYTGSGASAVAALNKELTLRGGYVYVHGLGDIWTPGVIPATIDGEDARQGLVITGNISPTIQLFTLINGAGNQGGNLAVHGAHPRLTGITVLSGTATTSGGGIYLFNSEAVLSGLAAQNNQARDGGGLFVQGGGVTILAGVIQGNTASESGGGLYLKNTATALEGALVISNSAVSGAGLMLDGPLTADPTQVPLILNTYVRYNQATGDGGGIYLNQAIAGILNVIVADNSATNGAGAYLRGASPLLWHTTWAQNEGQNGLFVSHAPGLPPVPSFPVLTNSIWVSHTVGVYIASTGYPFPLQNHATFNGTLWSNGADWAGPGEIVHQNDVTGDTRFTCTGQAPACLAPYHIVADSAALDAGVALGGPPFDLNLMLDIDGEIRPSGAGFDLGADEVQEPQGVFLLPPLSMLVAAPGQDVTHTLSLWNTSPATETFDLTFRPDHGWSTLVTATAITLGPQQNAPLAVRVAVPTSAAVGVQETTLLTATSRTEPDHQAGAVQVTQVITPATTDLTVRKTSATSEVVSGESIRFTVVLTDSGPLTDTVAVTLTDTTVPTTAIGGLRAPAGCTVNLATGITRCGITFDQPARQSHLRYTLDDAVLPRTWTGEFTLTTTENYSGGLVNTVIAALVSGIEANPADNVSAAAVQVIPPPAPSTLYLPLLVKQ